MSETTNKQSFLKSLIQSGIHFGHQTSRWCPKMARYIWGHKNNVHLIDVSKTALQLEKAGKFLESVASEGRCILWVGTKKPAQESIQAVAQSLNMPYVTHRWIGGTLSNFSQVKKSVTNLLHDEDILAKAEKNSGDRQFHTKKEMVVLTKEYERLKKNVGGIRTLTWPVGAVVIIDVIKEHSALKEAVGMGVPVVALVDTNGDPSLVEYVIPGNDDSPRAIKLVLDYLAQAVKQGAEAAAIKAVARPEAIRLENESIDLSMMESETEGETDENKAKAGRGKPEAAARLKRPKRPDFKKADDRGPRPAAPRKKDE
ncbi:hypothetical protein Noda2021_06780 [Candidatus Dependentiae bacterium Noda2021]|nr:hypothetical protein Noda2021_06780 [Candidatus Dependentiae bacterium Noda2021]